MVKVTTVPTASAMGTAVWASSWSSGRIDTREGGMCTTPLSSPAEATKPYFQSWRRAAADADTRAGAGRLGGCTSSTPRHWRNLA